MGSLLSTSQPNPEWKSDAQFAMESNWFCVICGSPFDLEGEVYNLDSKAARYMWMYKHRLLCGIRDVHLHTLEGLSKEEFHSSCTNTSHCDDIFLSEPAYWSVTDDNFFHIDKNVADGEPPDTVGLHAMNAFRTYDVVFPLHESCLQISCRAIEYIEPVLGNYQEKSSLTILNKMLQIRFSDNVKRIERTRQDEYFRRNDLFELCTATDTAGSRSVVGLSLLEWWAGDYEKFYTDPINIPNLTSSIFDLLQSSITAETDCVNVRPPARDPHRLERLPTELLELICEYLPVQSALAIHRTSKTLALNMPLSNSFWRKSIFNGKLIPYLWDLDKEELNRQCQQQQESLSNPDMKWNWRAVAHLLATKYFPLKSSDPRMRDLPNGLWNRRRIWSIIEEECRYDFDSYWMKDQINSVVEQRTRREPVTAWQLEEIMDDLGHYP